MSIPRRKDLDRILQTNSPRCPSCTDHDFDFFLYVQRIHILRTTYFQKTTLHIFPKQSIPKMFAARSRQIAEFEGAGPIQSSPPYHGHIDIFQTDPSQDETKSSFFQFPSSNHVKKPEICPQPKLGSEYNVCSLKNTLLKNERLLYLNETIHYV